jgi:hypothetical protein
MTKNDWLSCSNVIITLQRAIKILENNRWIRYAEARNIFGEQCNPRDKEAYYYCATGAIAAAHSMISERTTNTDNKVEFAVEDVLLTMQKKNPKISFDLKAYNDYHAKGKRDVIRLFKKTIKSLSQKLSQ